MVSHLGHHRALNTVLYSRFSLVIYFIHQFSSLSRVRLFVTPWSAAHEASLSIANCQSPPKPMSIELMMPSNHLILCRPLLLPSTFPSIRVFSNESALHIRWPIGASALVLVMNIQGWFPLGLCSLISLLSKGKDYLLKKRFIEAAWNSGECCLHDSQSS